MLTIVNLDAADLEPPRTHALTGCVVGISRTECSTRIASDWLEHASFTVSEMPTRDRRIVQVASIDATLDEVRTRVEHRPLAATILDDTLRAGAPYTNTRRGLITESLAYSTLQAGPEFGQWLAAQGPRQLHGQSDAVLLDREESTLHLRFNRPLQHNAFSNALRAGLMDGLEVVLADPSITRVLFSGSGRSFCSGGDLMEFGLLTDPAAAHLARTRHSPALLLDAVRERLRERFVAQVHGAVLGSGLEMAAYCGTIIARCDAVFGLPELDLGLIPGAGGTVSVPRRIGRWRTAYLVLTGRRIDAATALGWGLVDEIGHSPAQDVSAGTIVP
ncbi:enoyl-CoA hydratase/isomerase family protein [Rhodococcus koreensis]